MARFRICILAGFGLLLASAVTAAEAPVEARGNWTARSPLDRARTLLRAGQTAAAENLIHSVLTDPADDSLLCVLGEIHFRRADFTQATADFQAALDRNSANARAWWGLGRIEQLHFRTSQARADFSKAYQLDHRDPDIILSFAAFITDPAAKATLFDNLVRLHRYAAPDRAAAAAAELAIYERLQGRQPGRLASPYTAYNIPLTGYRPATATQDGLLLQVRVNGAKPLQLLLDTGARGIVLNARAARNLTLETVTASRLQGMGDAGTTEARVALARTVATGGLTLEDCLLEVSGRDLAPGADGVIGADVFAAFKIGIDARARMLHLAPFDEQVSPASALTVPALGIRNLLLVRAHIAGGKEGLFLMDTGAAYSVISPAYLPPSHHSDCALEMRGAQGPASAQRIGPVVLESSGATFFDSAPIAMDLAAVSQAEGVEIAGILGYSALAKSPFTLDLRHGAIEFPR